MGGVYIDDSIFESSILNNPKGFHYLSIWLCLCAMAKAPDGILDATHESIARRLATDVQTIRDAIAFFEAPDPDSRDGREDGRRMVRLDSHRTWGWRLVTYDKYRERGAAVFGREVDRMRKQAAKGLPEKTAHDPLLRPVQAALDLDGPEPEDAESERTPVGFPEVSGTFRKIPDARESIRVPITTRESEERGAPAFDEFWRSYPAWRRDSRKKTLAVWTRMSAEHRRTAVAAVVKFAEMVADLPDEDRPFVATARTWLSQERYLAEPETWTANFKGKRRSIFKSRFSDMDYTKGF